jgi:hypothetical protein
MTRKIIVIHFPKPIPTDRYDWEAVEDGYDKGDPIGFGASKQEAIDHLNERLDERDANGD